jgi:hypothetical protein
MLLYKMKKITVLFIVLIIFSGVADAQIPIVSVITTLAKKVIDALDLEVERLQNETVSLQNIQKSVENEMSKLQLGGIKDWAQKIKDLYAAYYQELSQVKQIVADYDKVAQVIAMQSQIISTYRSAYNLFKQDKNFSAAEISYMYNVYSGILDESLKNLNQVLTAIDAFAMQMTDESRIKIIDHACQGMQKNYNDLRQFNNDNMQLSLQRAVENNDLQTTKNLYGLP